MSTTPAGDVMYLGNNWLEVEPSNAQWYTTTSYTWPTYTTYKVRLKLSEVERLRDAARDDKRLRDVLNKLAPAIEIEVDF